MQEINVLLEDMKVTAVSELDLLPEEKDYLAQLLQEASMRSKYPLEWAKLMRRWQRFVEQVEKGYQDSIYEYTNDLSVRDLLQRVLSQAREPVRTKAASSVQPFDDRYFAVTIEVEKPIARRSGEAPYSSWWYRMPKKLVGELADDLRSQGITG